MLVLRTWSPYLHITAFLNGAYWHPLHGEVRSIPKLFSFHELIFSDPYAPPTHLWKRSFAYAGVSTFWNIGLFIFFFSLFLYSCMYAKIKWQKSEEKMGFGDMLGFDLKSSRRCLWEPGLPTFKNVPTPMGDGVYKIRHQIIYALDAAISTTVCVPSNFVNIFTADTASTCQGHV